MYGTFIIILVMHSRFSSSTNISLIHLTLRSFTYIQHLQTTYNVLSYTYCLRQDCSFSLFMLYSKQIERHAWMKFQVVGALQILKYCVKSCISNYFCFFKLRIFSLKLVLLHTKPLITLVIFWGFLKMSCNGKHFFIPKISTP